MSSAKVEKHLNEQLNSSRAEKTGALKSSTETPTPYLFYSLDVIEKPPSRSAKKLQRP